MENRLKDYIEQRAIESAHYLIENQATVRQTARCMGVSKSTTHKDLIERLPKINYQLYEDVVKVLETNYEIRHIRGGLATKRKYENLKEAR